MQAENETLYVKVAELALELMQCRTQIRGLEADVEVARAGQALVEGKLETIKAVIDE